MMSLDQLRQAFTAAAAGQDAADQLCARCVELLDVDGASLSLLDREQSWGTFGASGPLSRRLDDLQFTYGEGPCFDAVAQASPVLTADLAQLADVRWPVFTNAVLKLDIRGVFALPVTVDGTAVGALDLYRHGPGPLADDQLKGALLAASAAREPISTLIRQSAFSQPNENEPAQDELALLGRVEVAQATGMIMSQLDVEASEALLRLRAYAFAHDMTASEVAWDIVERRVRLDDDRPGDSLDGKRT